MKVCPLFVAHAQATELIQPSERPFHDPAPSPQAAAVIGVAHREQRHDAPLTQTSPDCRRVIATVAQHTIGTMTWTPALSLQGRNGINECEGLL